MQGALIRDYTIICLSRSRYGFYCLQRTFEACINAHNWTEIIMNIHEQRGNKNNLIIVMADVMNQDEETAKILAASFSKGL